MIDVTSLALLATSFFFVALSIALLVRYRQVSERINSSTDLGRDLWSSLERRLKKQDERILDMMGRVDVIQARAMSGHPAGLPASGVVPTSTPAPDMQGSVSHEEGHGEPVPAQQEAQESLGSHVGVVVPRPASGLDETQLSALLLLRDASKDTRQLTDALGKSREHTARIMKALFESGLVRRNATSKPFVYELTDEGRRRLPPPGPQDQG